MSQGAAETAVDHLQDLGLTEYEARCFVALSRFDSATAAEVSEVSELPRTRVYDTAERLQERGLVEIQNGSPRLFRAVPPERARQLLRSQYERSLDQAVGDLEALPEADEREEHGVWTVRGLENVQGRLRELCERADHELYISWATDREMTDEHVEWLRAAADRGVDVKITSKNADERERITEVVPDAFARPPLVKTRSPPVEINWTDEISAEEALNKFSSTHRDLGKIGWLAMADREIVMIATDGEAVEAVWAEGTDNGLVIFIAQWVGMILDFIDAYGPDEFAEKLMP